MIKLKKHIVFVFVIISHLLLSQGIVNNGGNIVLTGAAYIYIDGGANGGYLSQSGGIINPSATGTISLEGNWTNNSANTGFSADRGLVILNGANQTILGTNSITFYDLRLAGSGVKTQNINTSVGGVATTTGTLTLGSLIYDLNSNILTLTNPATGAVTAGTGYMLSETNVATNPSVVRWNMGTSTGAHIIPFGVAGTQIPLTFNKTTAGASDIDFSTRATAASDNQPWAGASNVGGVSFFYCPNNTMSGNSCAANSVIDRWWDITPSSAVTANITLSYRGSENTLTAPYDVGNVGIQWWDGSAWNLDNATSGSALAVTSGVGNVSANGLSQFCPFVISSVLVPLPVEISQMDVRCLSDGNLISWTTSSENNSDLFIVEKSKDAVSFSQIAQIKAAGNSKKNLYYSYIDHIGSDMQNISYYRIKEVDVNGNSKKYKVLSSQNCNLKSTEISISNTQDGIVFISINSSKECEYSFKIYNLMGILVKEEKANLSKGLNKIQLQTQNIQQSVYLLNVSGNGVTKNQKVAISNP